MVTGDNPQTAKAIALECGILSSEEDAVEPNVIEGKVFREYPDSEREEIAEKISVRINCLHLLLVFLCFCIFANCLILRAKFLRNVFYSKSFR